MFQVCVFSLINTINCVIRYTTQQVILKTASSMVTFNKDLIKKFVLKVANTTVYHIYNYTHTHVYIVMMYR